VIFVTVGTNEARFDRLLRAVDRLEGVEPIVVQHGASAVRPERATCFEYLPFDRLVELVRGARVVVTHAGVGSVAVALSNGKRPVVVPRLHRYGEAVDDHQLAFARRFHAAGLVTLIEDPASLRETLRPTAEATPPFAHAETRPQRLADDLRDYLGALIPAPSIAGSSPE
jgi:UDP-N-acetylglucosamine transferase subunit ALG13